MSEQLYVSIIVPVYNAELHIKKCLSVLLNQDFTKSFEIIMVDDASTDNSKKILKQCNDKRISLYSLPKNSGPGAARNLGLKMAKGKYIFFHDVDDTVDPDILTILYNTAATKDCDLVFCDRRYIENSQNQRANIFAYPSDKYFANSDIVNEMRKRFYDPLLLLGLFDFTGRLIRRSIIIDNKIFFEESLRYLEDETFTWDILRCIKSAIYIRKQLCSFFVHPNVNTALSESFNRGFNISNFNLVKSHIQNCLKQRGVSASEIEKIGNQAFIFYIISALISFSRSILLGKLDYEKSIKIRKKLINDIISDRDVSNSIKNYIRSKKESFWIPKLIAWRSHKLLEFACTLRAKKILRIRRKKI